MRPTGGKLEELPRRNAVVAAGNGDVRRSVDAQDQRVVGRGVLAEPFAGGERERRDRTSGLLDERAADDTEPT